MFGTPVKFYKNSPMPPKLKPFLIVILALLCLIYILPRKNCVERKISDVHRHADTSMITSTSGYSVINANSLELEEDQIFVVIGNNSNKSSPHQFETASLALTQDDPRLLKYIREHLFWPPRPIPYKLENINVVLNKREGQYWEILKILNNKRNGIFIEAGANDGEDLSNTLVLEKDYGWTGILVEPDLKPFSALLTKNRKAWLSNVCLSVTPHPEKVKFLHYKRTSTWSKVEKISDHHKQWSKNDAIEVQAKCIPFYSLVLALNMTTIDYFSLDVEGAELQILKTIPFNSVLIRTLSIEYDHIRLVPGADEELKRLMKSNGFKLVKEVFPDYIYAHKSVFDGGDFHDLDTSASDESKAESQVTEVISNREWNISENNQPTTDLLLMLMSNLSLSANDNDNIPSLI